MSDWTCVGAALVCGAVWVVLAFPTGWLVGRWLRWCGQASAPGEGGDDGRNRARD